MFRHYHYLSMTLSLAAALGIAGCGGNSSPPAATVETGHDHDHAHASEGPHGGSLLELGNEEYHAELVHDEAAGAVTIFVLDSAAKATAPIDAAEVTINLKHGDRGEQFKLAASPDQTDPPGKSSRYISTDAELAEDLDHEGAEPQLVITIGGKQYRANIEHDHQGQEDHVHAH